MSLKFVGGDRLQRGRGIGGLLRLATSVFKPLLSKVGGAALKVAKSQAGQSAIKSLKRQAIDSSLNVAGDLLGGKNLGESLKGEAQNLKQHSLSKLDTLRNNNARKRSAVIPRNKQKRKRRRRHKDILG